MSIKDRLDNWVRKEYKWKDREIRSNIAKGRKGGGGGGGVGGGGWL